MHFEELGDINLSERIWFLHFYQHEVEACVVYLHIPLHSYVQLVTVVVVVDVALLDDCRVHGSVVEGRCRMVVIVGAINSVHDQ